MSNSSGTISADDWLPAGSAPFSFSSFALAVKRGRRTIILALLSCWFVAGILIALTPVSYVASTQVMLEPLPRRPMAVALDGVADPLDSAQADSRMQVVKSERLLRFISDSVGWSSGSGASSPTDINLFSRAVLWLKSFTQWTKPNDDETSRTRTLLDFMDRVSVKRLGISYVIEISFQAKDPETAAFMANAVTAAYLRSLVISSQLDDEVLQRRFSNIKAEEQSLLEGMKRGAVPDQYFPDANARVISAAIKPLSKAAPKSTLIAAMATVLGLSIGIVLSITRHQRDRSIRTGYETFLPAGIRLLARFPSVGGSSWKRLKAKTKSDLPCLIDVSSGQLLLAEANDTLALRRHKILAFVSPRSGMGTSSVALSIAERAGRCGLRPTLVDANLSAPALSRFKTSETTQGLTDVLQDRDRMGRITPTDLGAFDFLSIGSRAEDQCTLSTPPIGPLLKELSKKGPVFVDLPAIGTSFDAQSVARYVDAFVLVLTANETQADDIAFSVTQLSGKVVGFVLNHMNVGAPSSRRRLAYGKPFGKASILVGAKRKAGSRDVKATAQLVEG